MKISSIKNPLIIEARTLQTSSYRKQSGKVLLYGHQHITWALDNDLEIEVLFTCHQDIDRFDTIPKHKIAFVSEGILKKISGTTYLIPYMAIARLRQATRLDGDFIIVLDNLQDFGNIGSIVRTSKGFSIDDFMFVHMSSDPFNRKIIDSSRGTVFDGNIGEYDDEETSINALKQDGYQIVVTSPHAQHLQSQAPLKSKKIALVIGNETSGVSQKFLDAADVTIQIPMSIAVESLNASVAAGISMYELKFKQVVIMLKEKIFANLGRQIGITGKLIRSALDKEISRCSDLNGMQAILMMIMALDKTMTMQQISQDTALFGDELQEFISPIEQKQYIVQNDDVYSLTDKGTEFLAEIWPIVDRTNQKILKSVSKEELDQLHNTLSKIQQGCNDIIMQHTEKNK